MLSLSQTIAQTQINKQGSLDVAAAVSGGVLLALLAILFVVITVIACRCFKKTRNRSQQRLYSLFTLTLLTFSTCMTNVNAQEYKK